MNTTVVIVFAFVYTGMLLGEIPGLALDRTGVALLGAIALLVAKVVSPEGAWSAVDVPTMALLFGLMVVSAQLRLGGFYGRVTRRITDAPLSPGQLLAVLVGVAGGLSAVLANDIVCLAMAPIVVESCAGRRLDPLPFLLALAAAANVGSAATLIGNPQNMLIGQMLRLSFAGYLLDAALPAALGLVVVWAVIRWQFTGRWQRATPLVAVATEPFAAWQTGKGVLIVVALMAAFLFTDWPRDVLAMGGAGVLLMSRRLASRDMLARVDWQLLVLFMALFVVNHALVDSGTLGAMQRGLASAGIDVARPAWLFGLTVVLSNLVSNVPAVMLLLPTAQTPLAGPILALASTLAGNLILVGSIANLIVVDQAARLHVAIGWRDHARVGVPITLLTLAVAAAWLWLRA
jgi:Na+/H+ antiporter NhaD/arsenite permease-like protein